MEALYYQKAAEGKVQCFLCPHNCIISPGKSGICRVRSNENGTLRADMYNCLSAMHVDPIEKKPLYHFHPGSEILSLGALGCNFRCSCCQNYEIAQTGKSGFPRLQQITVSEIMKIAGRQPGNTGIAYTYNEPFVWFEYMHDIAREMKRKGGKNVVVSNGYISERPLRDILELIDAFNIDLKAFDAEKYKEFTSGDLSTILTNLKIIYESGRHLEITVLVVPGINDSLLLFAEILKTLEGLLGRDVPLHLSRYFPRYKMNEPATSFKKLTEYAALASEFFHYVYIGNIPEGEYQDTICPDCGTTVIQRTGYSVRHTSITRKGDCSMCGKKIAVL